MQHNEKRVYQRGDHFECTAKVSEDGEKWFESKIIDLSSGGLLFISEKEYPQDTVLWFDILVEGFLSEFHVEVKGKVRRVQHVGTHYNHGIAFVDLDNDMKIRIDENVHSINRFCVSNESSEVCKIIKNED